MNGLWATFMGAVSERARRSANRAWAKVDKPSRHEWTGSDEQLRILQQVYTHRLRVKGGAR